jgi:esterase/lipase superfamily enzyme
MHVERHRWNSPALGQEMEVEVYGHAGRPILAFPSQDGRVADFAGFGMIDACREFLDAGRIRLVAVDGIDWQSWTNAAVGAPPAGARCGPPAAAWAPSTRRTSSSGAPTCSTG